MIKYQFNKDGSWAQKIVEGSDLNEWVNTATNPEYLAWLADGNTPNPYIPPPEPAPLTPQEKLAAAGLTVDELKALLGL